MIEDKQKTPNNIQYTIEERVFDGERMTIVLPKGYNFMKEFHYKEPLVRNVGFKQSFTIGKNKNDF